MGIHHLPFSHSLINTLLSKRLYHLENLQKLYKFDKSQSQLQQRSKSHQDLLVIVGVFLVCHMPRILYRLVYHLDYDNQSLWLTIVPIYQLALMINSAMNFFIYCLVGDQFQLEVCQLVRCQRGGVGVVIV